MLRKEKRDVKKNEKKQVLQWWVVIRVLRPLPCTGHPMHAHPRRKIYVRPDPGGDGSKQKKRTNTRPTIGKNAPAVKRTTHCTCILVEGGEGVGYHIMGGEARIDDT
eukprot:TRINITY_DN1348_c0_g1_i3.p2 TRINITY_DN1348_c0_g1~~TRINITY_DN1348_c0_g1_i3.p2  ORF type:complete len:107 (-),score=5.66 TRINITY_DN1348_c0_g1_i3:72-392(-)